LKQPYRFKGGIAYPRLKQILQYDYRGSTGSEIGGAARTKGPLDISLGEPPASILTSSADTLQRSHSHPVNQITRIHRDRKSAMDNGELLFAATDGIEEYDCIAWMRP
jgi:hypothetical protein